MSKNIDLVREMVRKSTHVSCSSISAKNGSPFISSLLVATDSIGQPVFLTSNLSKHTQNFRQDNRASILVQSTPSVNTDQDFPRASLLGKINPLKDKNSIERYLRRYPRAQEFSEFGDFNFYYLDIEKIYLVGGFASVMNISRDQYLCKPHLADIESDAIAHMNLDHKDALRRYGSTYLGINSDLWHLVGLDTRGMDLSLENSVYRVQFPETVTNSAQLRQILANL